MKPTLTRIAIAGVVGLFACVAYAGDDATSLSYISYLERYATVKPAGTTEALEAQINMPILSGDRLETARGARVETRLADGSTLWVDEFTVVDFDALAGSRDDPAERTALYIGSGSAAVEVPEGGVGADTVRVETPAGVVLLHRPGLFRVDLTENGAQVAARTGFAEVPVGVGSALVRAGQEISIGGSDNGATNVSTTAFGDDFWSWVEDRRHPQGGGQTARYAEGVAPSQAAVLDSYGDWVWVGDFNSWMWRPRVSVGWVPYSYGRWYWTPVGWDWISYEPWGWYPSHYGSWYLDADFGWVWCWDWVWGPAWVHWIYTPGYIGWCPRGYYDWWYTDHRGSPSRGWTRNALDFSGRVRLRGIDPRPWTVVPADRFGDGNIDRVRVDARPVLRGVSGDGFVSSGPLITRSRELIAPEETFSDRFRTSIREAPGLETLLGRQAVGGLDRGGLVTTSLRPVETVALVGAPVRVPVAGPRGVAGDGPISRTRGGVAIPSFGRGISGVGGGGAVSRGSIRERGRYFTWLDRVRSGGEVPAPRPRTMEISRPSSPSTTRIERSPTPRMTRPAAPPSHTTTSRPHSSGRLESVSPELERMARRQTTLRGGFFRSGREVISVERSGGRLDASSTPLVRNDGRIRVITDRSENRVVWELPPRFYPAPERPMTGAPPAVAPPSPWARTAMSVAPRTVSRGLVQRSWPSVPSASMRSVAHVGAPRMGRAVSTRSRAAGRARR
jgi:Family of unknown function (DUF6600)/FecR protein